MPKPTFTLDDFQLFERYFPAKNYGPIPEVDKRKFSSVREKVNQIRELGSQSDPKLRSWRSHLSILNPNGSTPKDYWCAVYPPGADNKSFSAQIAFIVSARGAEFCLCLGSGDAQIADPAARARNEQYFRNTQRNLSQLPVALVGILDELDDKWRLRRQWRLQAGADDYGTVKDWLAHASAAPAASISTYLTPAEVVAMGDRVGDEYCEVLQVFAPILEWIDVLHDGEPTDDSRVLSSPQSWLFAPGDGARLWEDFKRNDIVAIGWDLIGNLANYESKEAVAEAIRGTRDDSIEPINDALACWQFLSEMKPGDTVYVKRGMQEIIGCGVVSSEYLYDPNRVEYKNTRRISWDRTGSWPLPEDSRVPVKTLTNITRLSNLIATIERVVRGESSAADIESLRTYTIDDAIKDTFFSADEWTSITKAWARKLNLVLQGPPGVGKTFVAKRLAFTMMGERDPSRLLTLQFHQSYSYEEFVSGYRPAGVGLVLRPGVFKLFCEKARADQGRIYVAVIDEFNRANLSRVLGELMVLLEPDKRSIDNALPLTYDGGGDVPFWIPKNLLVLGLMNTADRSLAVVDYALRRRFAFIDLRPAFSKESFHDYLTQKGVSEELASTAIAKMAALNDQIGKDDRNLGPGFQIGHSYFCPNGSESSLDSDWYTEIIETEILPLLQEYWAGQPDRVDDAKKLLRL